MPSRTESTACPCGRRDAQGRALSLSACCGRFLEPGGPPAPDAESLMRSRYTAFTRCDAAYLQATWHAATRPSSIDFEPGIRWLGLEVRAHQATGPDRAEVEFVARSRPPSGPAHRLHERSRFLREGGQWFYVDGDLM